MTIEPRTGPFAVRGSLVREIILHLSSDHSVVLVGKTGFGKTALARETLRLRYEDSLVLHIRGTAAAAHLSYGSLSFLLSELDDDSLHHPILMLRGLRRYLRARARGRRIIFFVDNIEDLDDFSVMAITQLAVQRTVQLLAVCEALPAAPQEFSRLWRDGVLHRIDVGPLSFDEATLFLKTELNGPVSLAAEQELWTESDGNPLLLLALVREYVGSKMLVRSQGAWVLAAGTWGGPRRSVGSLVDVIGPKLNRMSEEKRLVMELVALAGSLPLKVLQLMVEPTEVDDLQEQDSLLVGPAPEWRVRISSSLIADVVRGNVPPARSCELRERLLDMTVNRLYPPVDVVSLASWTVDCGAPLDITLAAHAAHEANNRGCPHTALRLLSAVASAEVCPDLVCEEARASVAMGQLAAAREAVGRIPLSAQIQLAQEVDLAVLRSTLGGTADGSGPSARHSPEQLWSRTSECGPGIFGCQHEELWERSKQTGVQLATNTGHLTSREREVARHAAAGATNKRIANDLSLSVRTIEGHLQQIYGKLHVSSRSDLEKAIS